VRKGKIMEKLKKSVDRGPTVRLKKGGNLYVKRMDFSKTIQDGA
jgi:hypothetical protein